MSMITVATPRCMLCGQSGIVMADELGLEAWQGGVLIQDALPTLTSSQREQLMTGIHDECWNNAFGEDE